MQYSKPMIELVYEIRRRVPADLKPSVKLANPELFPELIEYYREKSTTTVTKALIKELFAMAGRTWLEALEGPAIPAERQVTKVYRGQVRLERAGGDSDKGSSAEQSVESPAPKKRRLVYRGRVVD